MGSAGRDPIFYAQLESEFAILENDGRSSQGAAGHQVPEPPRRDGQRVLRSTPMSIRTGGWTRSSSAPTPS